MSSRFQFMPINQLADKYPEGSWWARFHSDFDENQLVAYYEGDLQLISLDLDWEKFFVEQPEVLLIFINGNLTVDRLYNQETDGAIGLIVTGNLKAKNIAIGGQELYIIGNLTVEQILCGSYNHGEAIIEGDLNAAVLVEDGEYRFKTNGHQEIPCRANVWDGDGVYKELPIKIRELLTDEVFFDMDEDDEVGFSFGTLVQMIEEGRSALKNMTDPLLQQAPQTFYFSSSTIHEENILKLTQCILMPIASPTFDFEEQDILFKVQKEHIDADGEQRDCSVYMKDSQYHYYIWLEQDHSVGILRSIIGEDFDWEDVAGVSDEQLAGLVSCWTLLLTCVNMAELYLRNIEVEVVQNILQQPVIQALSQEDEGDDGYWDGSKYYSFRQAYTDADGDYWPARIEIATPDGAYYFYTLDNDSYVSRYYQPPNEYGSQDISYLNRRRWEASEQYFERFKKFMASRLDVDLEVDAEVGM